MLHERPALGFSDQGGNLGIDAIDEDVSVVSILGRVQGGYGNTILICGWLIVLGIQSAMEKRRGAGASHGRDKRAQSFDDGSTLLDVEKHRDKHSGE